MLLSNKRRYFLFRGISFLSSFSFIYFLLCCFISLLFLLSFLKDRKFNVKFVDLDFLLLLIQNEKRNGINFDKENISNLLQYKEDLIKQVNKVDNILKDIT